MRSAVPALRVRELSLAPVRGDGRYVLYWMVAHRRTSWSYSLDRAIDWAVELGRPLLVFEALSCEYPWASDRLHRFILDGMVDNARRLAKSPALYVPYVEPERGAGRGLLQALAADACLVITDDFPCFWIPRMTAAAARALPVRCEAVDSNGLLPLRAADRVFARAHDFRRFLQVHLPEHLERAPRARPFARRALPPLRSNPDLLSRWCSLDPEALLAQPEGIAALPIDHGVPPVSLEGGATRALAVWRRFLKRRLERYQEARNQPDADGTSGISPFLHFGNVSVHQLFAELVRGESWTPERLSPDARGSRAGWWGLSANAEALLDELVTWRELGLNMCWQRDDYDRYESLPEWALRTLEDHAADSREHLYSEEQLAQAATHDELWNAAQRQLLREGRIHGYLRMLWGKKILKWSPHPRDALRVMIRLNDRYALDGRDPNSYSGIGWVLGRYDRPWGPERPIFGTVRYMTSANTARKLKVGAYLARYGEGRSSGAAPSEEEMSM